jgi:hypothetical protein
MTGPMVTDALGVRWMRRLSTVLQRHALHLLLLFVALIVFCKPILLATERERPGRVMLELFVPWALIVVALFLVGRAHDPSNKGEDSGEIERD